MVASSEFKQQLLLREYGRNIKRLVDHVMSIEDRTQRSNSAQLLVNLMAQLNPAVREVQDAQQKLWNHLYVMSEGKLDVDAPYELSLMEYLNEKPQKVLYNQRQSKVKHYGQNVEKLIEKAIEVEDPEEKQAAIVSIGKLMKTLYKAYNKDTVTDQVIMDNMRQLSQGKLSLPPEMLEKGTLFDSEPIRGAGLPQGARGNNAPQRNDRDRDREGGGGHYKKKKKK